MTEQDRIHRNKILQEVSLIKFALGPTYYNKLVADAKTELILKKVLNPELSYLQIVAQQARYAMGVSPDLFLCLSTTINIAYVAAYELEEEADAGGFEPQTSA